MKRGILLLTVLFLSQWISAQSISEPTVFKSQNLEIVNQTQEIELSKWISTQTNSELTVFKSQNPEIVNQTQEIEFSKQTVLRSQNPNTGTIIQENSSKINTRSTIERQKNPEQE
jgi:hypothetical protein